MLSHTPKAHYFHAPSAFRLPQTALSAAERVIKTRSTPASLVATLRDFTFYVAPPGRSIRHSFASLFLVIVLVLVLHPIDAKKKPSVFPTERFFDAQRMR